MTNTLGVRQETEDLLCSWMHHNSNSFQRHNLRVEPVLSRASKKLNKGFWTKATPPVFSELQHMITSCLMEVTEACHSSIQIKWNPFKPVHVNNQQTLHGNDCNDYLVT